MLHMIDYIYSQVWIFICLAEALVTKHIFFKGYDIVNLALSMVYYIFYIIKKNKINQTNLFK